MMAQTALQTPYEASLYGSITGADPFQAILDRLVLRSDAGASPCHTRELIFRSAASFNTNSIYNNNNVSDDQPLLVCRRDLLNPSDPWIISTRGKPEPARLHPFALVRPAVHAKAQGDVRGFASTLGFTHLQSDTYKRGVFFTKGIVTITIFQLDTTAESEKSVDEAQWEIEAKTPPTNGSEALKASIDALIDVRDLLRGLVDLSRMGSVTQV